MEDNPHNLEIIGDGNWKVYCKHATFQVSQDALSAAGAQILTPHMNPRVRYQDTKHIFYHDADATRIILNIIHHNSEKVPLDLNAEALLHVAVVASDARCVSILGGYGRVWLYRAIGKATSVFDLARLLRCADLFIMNDLFAVFSQRLVCGNAAKFEHTTIRSNDLNSWLEESLLSIDKLERNRQILLRRTEIAIWDLYENLCKCQHVTAREFARGYFTTLSREGILPGTEPFKSKCYTEICEIAAGLPPKIYYPPGKCTAQRNCNVCNLGSIEQVAYLSQKLTLCVSDNNLQLCRWCARDLPCMEHL